MIAVSGPRISCDVIARKRSFNWSTSASFKVCLSSASLCDCHWLAIDPVIPAMRMAIPTTKMYVVTSKASSLSAATSIVCATKNTATPAVPRNAPVMRYLRAPSIGMRKRSAQLTYGSSNAKTHTNPMITAASKMNAARPRRLCDWALCVRPLAPQMKRLPTARMPVISHARSRVDWSGYSSCMATSTIAIRTPNQRT